MRTVAGIFGTLGLLIACSSAPDAAIETASPDNRASAKATLLPGPTATVLPTPTVAKTSTPAASQAAATLPTPVSTAGAPLGFGADIELFSDDFSDTVGGWQVYSGDGGSVAYDPSGALRAQVFQDNSLSSLSTTIDAVAWDVVRVEGTFDAQAVGPVTYLGLLCGSSTEDFAGAALGTNGLWAFLRKSGTEFHGLGFATGPTALVLDHPVRMRLECAGTNTGSMRMQLWVDGVLVSTYDGDDGPSTISNVGVYVEGVGNDVLIDDVVAYGGIAADLPPPQTVPSTPPVTPAPVVTPVGTAAANPALEALLTHVPVVMRQACSLTTSFDLGAQVQTQCLPDQIEGYVSYTQFDTVDNLRASFLDQLDFFGDGATGSDCAVGPSQQIYSIADAPAGRLMCNAYDTGMIAIWTHEGLRIIGVVVFFEGTYQTLYDTWLTAGPV